MPPLRAADRKLGLSQAVAPDPVDKRKAGRVDHSAMSMLRQRLYGLVAGCLEFNDAEVLPRAWPRMKIVFRDNSGSCRDLINFYCDHQNIKDVRGGICRNERLLAAVDALI